jgi:hypothetical protein
MSDQNQLRLRVTLPDDLHGVLSAVSPSLRSKMVSMMLVASMDGVDLKKLQESGDQLRRYGVLLNQALRAYYLGGVACGDKKLDLDRVQACVEIIWRLQSTRYP